MENCSSVEPYKKGITPSYTYIQISAPVMKHFKMSKKTNKVAHASFFRYFTCFRYKTKPNALS